MAFSRKIYFRILGLGLGSVALALHVSGLGLGLVALALTTVALLTSRAGPLPAKTERMNKRTNIAMFKISQTCKWPIWPNHMVSNVDAYKPHGQAKQRS